MDAASRKAQLVCDKKKFEESLPKIIDQIVGLHWEQTKDAIEHYQQLLSRDQPKAHSHRLTGLSEVRYACNSKLNLFQNFFKLSLKYNLLGGKMNRAMTVLTTWRLLLGDRTPTDDEYLSAIVLAWCVELLQASFLVADDIMDQSQTRRGQPCWYKQENIGLVAMNDAFMLECSVYRLVDINFQDKKCYPNLIALLHRTTFQTETGQTLDLIIKPGENFCNFTLDRYKAIVKWKTGYYSFYLPVALAMYMMDITDEEVHERAMEIYLEMGEFFQIQDDYLDCYGDPAVTGKVGTDIEETKCSWLLVQALQKVDEEQMNVLKENYGINDPVAVAKVKEVYSKLDMKAVYHEYEESSYGKLMQLIDKAPCKLPKEIFTELAAQIYKRNK